MPFAHLTLWMKWLSKEENWNIVICITQSSYFQKVIPFPWESWCFYPSKKVLTHMPQRVTLHCALHRYVAFVITRVGIFTEFLIASETRDPCNSFLMITTLWSNLFEIAQFCQWYQLLPFTCPFLPNNCPFLPNTCHFLPNTCQILVKHLQNACKILAKRLAK